MSGKLPVVECNSCHFHNKFSLLEELGSSDVRNFSFSCKGCSKLMHFYVRQIECHYCETNNRLVLNTSNDPICGKCSTRLLPIGAHLKSPRYPFGVKTSLAVYTHHGIYIGNGEVVHYSGLVDDIFNKNGPVIKTDFEIFLNKDNRNRYNELSIVKHKNSRYSGPQVVRRAVSKIGEKKYSVVRRNCEHFAYWCVTGESKSEQVQYAMIGSASVGVAALSGAIILGCAWPACILTGLAGVATGVVGGTSLSNSKIPKAVSDTAESLLRKFGFV